MIDTGMNRLGIRSDELDLADGVAVATLMSHLACADEDSAMNRVQRDRFAAQNFVAGVGDQAADNHHMASVFAHADNYFRVRHHCAPLKLGG